MTRAPDSRPQGLSAGHRVALGEWLAQWRLDRAFERDPEQDASRMHGESARTPGEGVGGMVNPFSDGPPPEVGHIRLLSPGLVPAARGPTFVAVLKGLGAGDYLAAPFSRFQTPALPHEICLRESSSALAVLCLWNARPVSGFALSQSWYVGQLSAEELRDALALCNVAGQVESVPNELVGRVGPPLWSPIDLRLEYMDAEGELWQGIAALSAEADETVSLPFHGDSTGDAALKMAAESDVDFACAAVLEVMRRELSAYVFRRRRAKTLLLVVAGPTGDASPGLDGTRVFLDGVGLSGRIESGQCLLNDDGPTSLALKTPSGLWVDLSVAEGGGTPQGFSFVNMVAVLGANPDAASVLTDSELRCLTRHRLLDPGLDATVTAEGYFRAWLYEGASRAEMRAALESCRDAVLDGLLDGVLATVRSQQTWVRGVVVEGVGGRTRAVWERMAVRIRSFVEADGIIPVVIGDNAEAVPIAFTLRANELPGTALRDVAGIPIPLWDVAGETLGELVAQHIGLQLQCSTRGTGRRFDGESFELPVVLALARKRGSTPDYPTLSVMATGAIRGGVAAPVSGMDAKTALARKMGVKVFVSPGAVDGDVAMGASGGVTVQELVYKLGARLERAGLDRLDTKTAADRLNTLGDEIHLGTVALQDATVRLDRYERVLENDPTSAIATEGLIRAKVLRGAIANHSGCPQAAALATQEAADLATRRRMPLLYVNAMANRIVSLTDLGHLEEAESGGRQLLEWVLSELSGASAERLQAEMVACGVLGGQALLQRALQGAECGQESLRLLVRALEIAQELQLPADTCRDAVQIALWYALLDPTLAETAMAQACAVLEQHPGEWTATNLAHLQRVRFLGAYRVFLLRGSPFQGFADWPLPAVPVAPLGWVRATALKYRGVLLAAQHSAEAAEADFAAAWAALDRESAPLLRFIAGTVALAAGEALLGENRPLAMAYLQKAKGVFSLPAVGFAGPVKGSPWLERTEGLLAGSSVRVLPDPQRGFPY